MTKPTVDIEGIVEEFAEQEHTRWSNWQQWVFDCSTQNEDGSVTIPVDKVERWKRQIATPYSELSEQEKEKDREQVYPYIDTLTTLLKQAEEEKQRAVEELLSYLPDATGRYNYAWEECTIDEQDAVKAIRKKYTPTISSDKTDGF